MKTIITNALIRCTRDDTLAKNAFDRVREDLNIWVRELSENLEDILSNLSKIRSLLRDLRFSSLDYTLHIATQNENGRSLSIPVELSELAGYCGFNIELVTNPS